MVMYGNWFAFCAGFSVKTKCAGSRGCRWMVRSCQIFRTGWIPSGCQSDTGGDKAAAASGIAGICDNRGCSADF